MSKTIRPKAGDKVEFKDSGRRYELLEVSGDKGRICVDGKDRWIDVSSKVADMIPMDQMPLLPAFDKIFKTHSDSGKDSVMLMGTGDEARAWRDGFKAATMSEHMPITTSAMNRAGDAKSHARTAIRGYDNALSGVRQEAARLQRDIARRKVKHKVHAALPTDAEQDADFKYVAAQIGKGIVLEKPQGSSLHHMLQYIDDMGGGDLDDRQFKFLKEEFQSMVIEHDWAKAMEGVDGFNDDGDVPMPFDFTCFEFRISGMRVLVMMGADTDGKYTGCMCTGVNGRWYINAERFRFIDGKFSGVTINEAIDASKGLVEAFLTLIGRQIRAVCIMLDSDVAEREPQPPSRALNDARRKQGRVELKTYHIVRLARKHRERAERREEATSGRHVRCHYRRGHWRHYELPSSGEDQYTDRDGILRSKSWINWMLVGDMNLGFVDKEYRL